MALAESLPDGSVVAHDTNIIIYLVEQHPDYVETLRPVFRRIDEGLLRAHVSTVSLMEVLVLPLRQGRTSVADEYREIFLNSPNVVLHSVTTEIAEQAAAIRARHNLSGPDAIVAATALEAGCTHLVTNDARFRSLTPIEVLVVREHAEEKG